MDRERLSFAEGTPFFASQYDALFSTLKCWSYLHLALNTERTLKKKKTFPVTVTCHIWHFGPVWLALHVIQQREK